MLDARVWLAIGPLHTTLGYAFDCRCAMPAETNPLRLHATSLRPIASPCPIASLRPIASLFRVECGQSQRVGGLWLKVPVRNLHRHWIVFSERSGEVSRSVGLCLSSHGE